MKNIDKSKLVFIKQDNIQFDSPLKTKEIGFYRDAWNRFKKNKASLVAFFIIAILMFFVVFGPYMKTYPLATPENATKRARLLNLPPKMPLLEKMGILNGHKTISRNKQYLVNMAKHELGQGIIISGMPDVLLDDDPSNDGEYAKEVNLEVVVDMYRFLNYSNSVADAIGNDVSVLLTENEFQDALQRNAIIEVLSITNGVYKVKVDYFRYALNQNVDDTYFWFGTDGTGRDLFTVLWTGARISIMMALVVIIINATVGTTIGAITGYYGGLFDLLFDRFVDILGSIPFLAVLTILVARFGSPLWVIVLTFTVTGWIGSYGGARIQFYRFKNREYVLAAKTLGASDARVMFKHIFPNAMGIMITGLVLAIPSFIIGEATYSFLGIFDYGQNTSVGMLLSQGQDVMSHHPHILMFPAIYILVMMIAFNLFGNGLRDAFNPSLRGVE